MVMERVQGVLINDVAELQRRGANIQRLAENGVEIFFTQAFRHNFFHADMHPGNIFVLLDNPEQPQYAAVDFGIVGTLAPRDQHYLAENFIAFFDHDYRRIAQLHIDSGWIPSHVRVDELESAVRTVCEPIANKPLREISFGQVLISLFEAAQRFDAQMQPQLMLIQKTLLQIEGVGRQLYPDLDLWKTAQPLLRQWVAERWSVRALARDVRKQLPDMLQALHQLPPLVENAIQRASDGRFSVTDRYDGDRTAEANHQGRRPPPRCHDRDCGRSADQRHAARDSRPAPSGWPIPLLGASIAGLLTLRK